MKKTVGIDALAIALAAPLHRAQRARPRTRRRSREVHARASARARWRSPTRARTRSSLAADSRPPRCSPRRGSIRSGSACSSSAPRPASITASRSRRSCTGCSSLPRAMRVYDTQHACYGGTAGLMAAVEWIASGAGRGSQRARDLLRHRALRRRHRRRADAGRRRGRDDRRRGSGAARASTSASRAPRQHARPRLLAPARSARGARSTATTPCSATSRRSRARTAAGASARSRASRPRARAAERAARAHLLPRAVLQDGEEGARPPPPLRSRRCRRAGDAREDGTPRPASRRRSRRRWPLLARRQHLHGLALPRARRPARRAGAPRSPASAIGLFSYGSGCTSEFFSGVVGAARGRARRGRRVSRACSPRASGSRSPSTSASWSSPRRPTSRARARSRSPASKSTAGNTRAADAGCRR